VERLFSEMKRIKTTIRNKLGQPTLNYLLAVTMNSPEDISEDDVKVIT
jgi:hypothetical protein